MNDSVSSRIPLLSGASGSATRTNPKAGSVDGQFQNRQHRSLSESGRLASSAHIGEVEERHSKVSSLASSGATQISTAITDNASTPDDLEENKGLRQIEERSMKHGKGMSNNTEIDDDDDLVAIAAEADMLQGHGRAPGYRQIDESGMRGGLTKEVIRRLSINLALICSWFFFSTMMNLYNSWLFSNKRHNFSYPLFVTSMHMFVQFGLSSAFMGLCHRNRSVVPRRPNGKRARPEARDWVSKVVPCALATALDIGLSNLSLQTITLTFYTMCKSSNLAFVLFFAFLFKLEKLRWSLIGIIALITIGVIMMVAAETQFVLVGAIQVLTASAMGGLRWALTQMLLHKREMGMNNPIATIFWLSPLMGAFMIFSSAFIEDWATMFRSSFFKDLGTTFRTIGLMVTPGFIAFLMNLSEYALIQRTSVMTLSVAGIFKEIATIFISSTVFGDELTPINVTGLCIALTGIGMYNYLKYRLLMQNLNDGSNDGHHRLQDDDNDGCTEMGGTILPATESTTRAGGSGAYAQIPRSGKSGGLDDEDDEDGDNADAVELSQQEVERRHRREEEAELAGWHTSGIIRTGDGYHDDESESNP